MTLNLAAALRLMLVTDDRLVGGRDVVALAREAAAAGVTSFQLRLKETSPRELAGLVRRIRSGVSIPIIVNDRLDVALAAGADGVHLGPDDVPVAFARRLAPPGFLVGASVGGEAEVQNGLRADYWGIGPYRVTGTKSDAGAPLGPDGLRRVLALAPAELPCVAIGGIRPGDLPEILATGVAGVAVAGGIMERGIVGEGVRKYLR